MSGVSSNGRVLFVRNSLEAISPKIFFLPASTTATQMIIGSICLGNFSGQESKDGLRIFDGVIDIFDFEFGKLQTETLIPWLGVDPVLLAYPSSPPLHISTIKLLF